MIEKILDRLDKVTKRGPQGYMARCPAHDDKTPSLALSELSDGRILIKCFAGCGASDVLAAVGLEMGDLFPDGQLGEFKGFQRLEEDWRSKKNNGFKLSVDEMTLEIAKHDRERGIRLSASDLEKERQAYIRVRNANTE